MSDSSKIHVCFCGTSAFAVPSLATLMNDPAFSVNLVITQPDRPVGRSQEMTAPPVKDAVKKHDLKIVQPEKLNVSFADIKAKFPRPDFLVVVSYGQILSQEVLDWPKVAPVNVHASLLPRWRGASPLQNAILAGDASTGVTVQKIVKELDAGPVLAQKQVTLEHRETVSSLHDKLASLGAVLLARTLSQPLLPVEQDPANVTLCKKLTREDGVADAATMTAEEIDRRVRALNPWPGVTATVSGQVLKILETSLEMRPDATPLDCMEGTVFLVKVQPAGKKPMSGADWRRGVKKV